jgi:hypothetical protein
MSAAPAAYMVPIGGFGTRENFRQPSARVCHLGSLEASIAITCPLSKEPREARS